MASILGSHGEKNGTGLERPDIFWMQFPLVQELRTYTLGKLRADIVAGATLTLFSVPQAMGFAFILGLPPMPVIVSLMVGGFVGAFFFSSRHHVFGPTNSVSLIVASLIAAHSEAGATLPPLQLAVFMALIIGGIQFLAGLFHFGSVTKFISRSVVIAYSTAIGLMIAASQLRYFLGSNAAPTGHTSFLNTLHETALSVLARNIAWADCAIGLAAIAIAALTRRWRPNWPDSLLALFVLAAVACFLAWHAGADAPLPFHIMREASADGALGQDFTSLRALGFTQEHLSLLPSLLGSAAAVSLIGMLEAATITKSLSGKSGQIVDPNRELLGMGAANIACGLCGAVPGSSSFTRSAMLFQSGGRTQLASMFSSFVVLLALLFITPAFNYIPTAALAAVLVCVGLRMIDWRRIRIACCSTRSDATVFAITLAAALFLRLDIAIYAGIGISLALFLQKTSSPVLVEYAFDESGSLAQIRDKEQRTNPQIAIIHVEGELFFGAADVFLTQIRQQAVDENIRIFILRLKNARHLDASTVMALESLHESLHHMGQHLLVSGCTPDVLKVIHNSGVIKILGHENVFAGDPGNPNVSTRKALIRASQLLSSDTADIRIFYDKRRSKNIDRSNEPPAYTLDFQI
ncbi:MAG: SulP family inorganic anion transporter [Puniceicoccales bacterium]|jgi:SulP family sulfate permease|nr:SulP family inorganic anion transporter [Puniceicoccales bacterium]